ncbi:MAG: NAD(P)H-quinone oxidoreductase [Planctomycetota bacterium]
MRAIAQATPGAPGTLRLEELPDPVPRPGELLLEVAAAGINRADLLQRRGLYPAPPGASLLLGLEVAGRALNAAGGFQPGDEVMALLAGGGYAERVVVDPRHALPVPRAIGLTAAGGVMEAWITAYLNLSELGGLRAGERVLIHGGSGGVGNAALQWAAHLGAEVWTTASAPKLARCRALGAARALDHASEDFAAELEAAGGADLILDIQGARYLEPNLRALRPDGRLVVIGLQGGTRAELDLGRLLMRRLRLIGSTLRALDPERKAGIVARFRDHVWPLLDQGRVEVGVHATLPLAEAAEAHRLLESGQVVGKLLLVV